MDRELRVRAARNAPCHPHGRHGKRSRGEPLHGGGSSCWHPTGLRNLWAPAGRPSGAHEIAKVWPPGWLRACSGPASVESSRVRARATRGLVHFLTSDHVAARAHARFAAPCLALAARFALESRRTCSGCPAAHPWVSTLWWTEHLGRRELVILATMGTSRYVPSTGISLRLRQSTSSVRSEASTRPTPPPRRSRPRHCWRTKRRAATRASGPLDAPASRKAFHGLIGTLTVTFPDHDFAGAFRRWRDVADVLAAHAAGCSARRLLSISPSPARRPRTVSRERADDDTRR
jgi:hypothetical protein